MDVEIYDEREINSETLTKEPDEEALAIIKEMGLEAQMNKDGGRIAYPQPTADQGFVMEQLFPAATRLEKYSAGAIPLRVLKEARSYKQENPGHTLIVRHCAPAQLKDPILLAFTNSDQHDYYCLRRNAEWQKFALIARWGDALEAWDKLLERAVEAATKATDEALAGIIAKATAQRAAIASGVKIRTSQTPSLHEPNGSLFQ